MIPFLAAPVAPLDIARHALAANILTVDEPAGPPLHVLVAGRGQFRTLWSRDLAWATVGALEAGHTRAVRDSLAVVLSRERDDGLLPRTVDRLPIKPRVVLGVLGVRPAFREPLRGWFVTESHVVAIDSNVMIPWAASEYVARTGDTAFAERWLPAVDHAFAYLEDHYAHGGLIAHQPPFSDWEDSIRRTGQVALTNEVYIVALRGAADWARRLGKTDLAARYESRADHDLSLFQDTFWDDGRGAVRNFVGDDHLTADANFFAVAHGLLPRPQAERALDTLERSPLFTPMPGRATVPDYPRSFKTPYVKLGGIPDYHDRMYWLWITALAAEAEGALGRCDARQHILDALSHRLVTDGDVYEVFTLHRHGDLRPVRRWRYHAEHPFTWSAGMILEAAAQTCLSAGEPTREAREERDRVP